MDEVVIRNGVEVLALSAATTARLVPFCTPFILLDRVVAADAAAGSAECCKAVTMTDPVLSGHFPDFPLYPGVLMLEAMAQTACLAEWLHGALARFGTPAALLAHFAAVPGKIVGGGEWSLLAECRVKFTQPVYPGEVLQLRALRVAAGYDVAALVRGHNVAGGRIILAGA